MRFLIFALIFPFAVFSQSHVLTGTVQDSLNTPLENANVIAKPLQEKANIKFAIADNKGRYKLELEKTVGYEITVSYIGYSDAVFMLPANSEVKEHHFKLKNTGEQLKEIVIKHEYKPIEIKKDTLTYSVKAFASGNERKMKEVLEKLPGVEVDKNGGVTVQGKKVTKMLVEGKSFFGGGSKLAVENIPADALDKIEVIDNFNEVGFLKKVSDSEDLAMNVKLKEDKKKFVFGDVEAGGEVANDNGFYLLHAALFYYSPKTNLSFIGDMNTVGKRAFTFQDLMRFQGGASSFLTGRKSLTNLYTFAADNTDVTENKSQFTALNFSHELSKKIELSGFGIFSKVVTVAKTETENQYLQNAAITFESKTQQDNNASVLALGNVKLDYSPNNAGKLYYNAQYQASTNDYQRTINSVSNLSSSTFEVLQAADNASLKQYLEWHKSINSKHTTTFVVNHAYEKAKPQNDWLTDTPFLAGYISLEADVQYKIRQVKNISGNSIDALFKHYWILNNYNHLYTNIGNNFGRTHFITSEQQLLSNGSVNDFATAGFGNDLQYQLNDFYVGLEYKFKIGNWINKPGVYWHHYLLKTNQTVGNKTIKTKILPQWDSEYEFNKSETLKFKYRLNTAFATPEQMAGRFTLQSYNSVFMGNTLLENELYHTASLLYSKMSMYKGLMLNASTSFSKKTKTLRNQIVLDGINQYTTPTLTDNPETNWRMYGAITKQLYKFNVRFNTALNWFTYVQNLNAVTTTNERNNQNLGISVRTTFKKLPILSLGYTKGFNQTKGIAVNRFETDAFTTELEYSFFANWTFKGNYENFSNKNSFGHRSRYEIANASLDYQKKNSPWGFELSAQNFLNNGMKNNNSFSDYMISEQTTYVLPRVVMLSVRYKI
ncbi:carboxypeptidase-like regulatory domain-containing protein [Flavobacterium enshiense]|uniref:carboxypeptidase-like regulatory domain-containing protein n=1 Tax=Flavobacterium enshiense TaxID=1341165 RepID=UPI00345DE79E